jgi:hypothetical protein
VRAGAIKHRAVFGDTRAQFLKVAPLVHEHFPVRAAIHIGGFTSGEVFACEASRLPAHMILHGDVPPDILLFHEPAEEIC